jgi:deazaflavin-dependent oxidoreductase (nitroreductase family)
MTNQAAPHDPKVRTKPRTPPRWFVRASWIGHRALLRLSGGRIGLRRATPQRWGMLRLHTLGRRSGEVRSAILSYLEAGEGILLLATNGMDERPPAWWLNLQTTPDAIIDLPDGTRDVRARQAVGAERERLWGLWVGLGGGLDAEAAALRRQIPVMVLEPRPD